MIRRFLRQTADLSGAGGGTSLVPAVITNPSLSTQNVIQAIADVPDLTLLPFADNQASPVFQVQNQAGSYNSFLIFGNGNVQMNGAPSSSGTTSVNSPNWRLQSTYWNGSASVTERMTISNNRTGAGNSAGLYALQFLDQSGFQAFAIAGSGGQVSIAGSLVPSVSTLSSGQLHVRPSLATTPGIVVQMASTPSAPGFRLQDSAAGSLWVVTQLGDMEFRRKDSTTEGVLVGGITAGFNSNTHASYTGRMTLSATDFAGTREVIRMEGDGTVGRLSFFGAAAVVQQANASQATINAVTDANAKAALQSIYNLLVNYALAPATA